jgi:hypothetical protein
MARFLVGGDDTKVSQLSGSREPKFKAFGVNLRRLSGCCTTSVHEARIGAVYDLSAVLSTNRSEWTRFQSTN